jgi:thiol-disulfide isomerase/thioredoxin
MVSFLCRARSARSILGIALALGLLGRTPLSAGELPEPGPSPPEFASGLTWLNSEPLTVAGLKGKVFMVDFWEYTCVNCIRTLPYLSAWHDRYAGKGLVIIGVHTPEFAFAKDLELVRRATKSFNLKYPIVNDADYKTWNSYGNRYWPAKFLFDSQGRLRYYHFGEGAYGDTEQAIQKLLREVDATVSLPPIMEPIRGEDKPGAVCYPVTPELYAGYLRGLIGNPDGFKKDEAATYQDPGDHQDGSLYIQGQWHSGPESLRHARATEEAADYVALRYHALEVNCVLKPESGKPARVIVTQDGKPVSTADRGADLRVGPGGETYLQVDEPKMYRIIKNAAFGTHDLKLACAEEGLGVYAFTFVSCVAPERPAGQAPPGP